MPTQVQTIYEQVCNALLEDQSALAGDFTEDSFLSVYQETILDFCGKTGVNKKLFNVPFQAGVQLYTESNELGDLLYAMGNQTFLYQSSDFYLSNTDQFWPQSVGQVQFYREDEIDAKQVQVSPAPLNNGQQISVVPPSLGVISGTVEQIIWEFTGGPGYGLVASASGPIAVLASNPGYGAVGGILTPPAYSVTPSGYGTINAGNGAAFECPDYLPPLISYGLGIPWQSSGLFLQSQQPGFGTYAQVAVGLGGTVPVEIVGLGYGVPYAFTPSITPLPATCACACSGCADFQLTADPGNPGVGTVNGWLGGPYLETKNQGFGILCEMVPSAGNLSLIGTALPYDVDDVQLTDWVELIPDSFTQYLKYGALAKIFGSSAETKDSQKAAYCQARFSEGINLLTAISCEDYVEK